MVQNRVQHPPPHPPRTTQPQSFDLARSITVNVNQVLQDQRRLECMQAQNTACNSYYSGLKPHRTSALNLAFATAARSFLGGELLQAQNTPHLEQIIVYQTPNSQGLDALATQRQSATAALSFLKIELSNPPLSVPPMSKQLQDVLWSPFGWDRIDNSTEKAGESSASACSMHG